MRRILAVLVLVLAGLGAGAETVKGLAKPTGYVSDYAGVLSPDEKATIEQQCTELHQKTGTQVAVVTIHRLEGATAQEFAHGLSDAWGVGSKGTDKGVVMLIATDDRKRWIDVGYGLEGALNDAKVGDIGRAMVPALKVGKYGEGIELGVGQISDAILADTGDAGQTVGFTPKTDQGGSRGLVALFFFGGLGGLVILLILLARRRRSSGPGSYETGISPTRGSGFFVSGGDSGGSGFSSDSGSSSDTSSSSGSDFGGFDGGSSGGGGAGGDF